MIKTPRFNGTCKYVRINGSECGKKCMDNGRCAQHRNSVSYSKKCTIDGCDHLTKSSYGVCKEHQKLVSRTMRKAVIPDEVQELSEMIRQLGFSVALRKINTPGEESELGHEDGLELDDLDHENEPTLEDIIKSL